MFETLEEQIQTDEEKMTTKREKVVRWTLIVVLSIVLFSALYVGIHLITGA